MANSESKVKTIILSVISGQTGKGLVLGCPGMLPPLASRVAPSDIPEWLNFIIETSKNLAN